MYNVVFEGDNGSKYWFGKNGSTVFDMDIGGGVSVNIGTSQGFSQVGETVQSRTVSGRAISVSGVVYGNVFERKRAMRKLFSPFSSGKLVFEGRYYIRVYVKSTPAFSPTKDDGRFSMQLFAPYPFFKETSEKVVNIGTVTALFSFPVNYSTPHKFGESGGERYRNVYNDSDVSTPFSIQIGSYGTSTNPVITNLKTLKSLKINGTINVGSSLHIYRGDDNILRAELICDNQTVDAISWIDESSDLFELEVGDNLISATDDEGGASLSVRISYNPVVVAVYES